MPDYLKQEESPGVGVSWAFVLYRLDTVILLPTGIIAYADSLFKIPQNILCFFDLERYHEHKETVFDDQQLQ